MSRFVCICISGAGRMAIIYIACINSAAFNRSTFSNSKILIAEKCPLNAQVYVFAISCVRHAGA